MGAPKSRGVITQHSARYHNDREIKPCRYIGPKGGKGLMDALDAILVLGPSGCSDLVALEN